MNNTLTEKRAREFAYVERISSLLDSKYKIGGFSFGLDPLLNFIPYAGGIITLFVSMSLVLVMLRNGAGSKVGVKMLLNILYDALLGAIPFFGNVFDFFSKANSKNVQLLKEHYFQDKHQGSAKGILITLFLIILLLCIAICYLMWVISEWIITSIAQFF